MDKDRSADFRLSFEEWQLLEAQLDTRFEYLDGAVRMVFGADRVHGIVCANLITAIGGRMGSGASRGIEGRSRLRLRQLNRVYYPDVMVSGDPLREPDATAMQYPSLVAEVVNEATAAIDRLEKARAYKSIESLRYYLLVDPRVQSVAVWSRASGEWETKDRDMYVSLTDIAVHFPCAEAFEGL